MKKAVIFLVVALCGVMAEEIDEEVDVTNRISNGNPASFAQFPYTVSIQRMSATSLQESHRGHICGGTLITFQHVLTAASCLFEVVNGVTTLINPFELRVFSGSSLLTDDFDQNRVRTIQNFTIHPDYIAPPASLNDIAVITLAVPFPNITAEPIALPVANFNPPDFTLCQIASWGAENFTGVASTNLRFTSKYVYSQSLCTMLYSGIPMAVNIFDTMVCAASFDIISSGCYGDEGTALVCNGGLTGIMFHTNACLETSFPEVYTRVSNYTTWIRSITGGASTIRADLTFFAILAIVTAKLLRRE